MLPLQLLGQADLERIHARSLGLLQRVGVQYSAFT